MKKTYLSFALMTGSFLAIHATVPQESTLSLDDYQAWKQSYLNNRSTFDGEMLGQIKEDFNKEGAAHWIIFILDSYFNQARKSSYQATKAFYYYNYLRELFKQPLAQSFSDIDPHWFYTAWKESIMKEHEAHTKRMSKILGREVRADKLSLKRYVQGKAQRAIEELHTPKKQSEAAMRRAALTALYAYNFLRELLHQSTVSSVDQIDPHWLETAVS